MAEIPDHIIRPQLLSQLEQAATAYYNAFDRLNSASTSAEHTDMIHLVCLKKVSLEMLKREATREWFRTPQDTDIPPRLKAYIHVSNDHAEKALLDATNERIAAQPSTSSPPVGMLSLM
jgi:hypothetical protein